MRLHSGRTILGSIILLLLCSGSHQLVAQQKYEREYRLDNKDVPATANNFVQLAFPGINPRWYGEEGISDTTIEAKLRSRGTYYSVEFNRAGKLQDIELLTYFSKIPTATLKRLKANLDSVFLHPRVLKTQVQWSGAEEQLLESIRNRQAGPGITVRYELIVRGRKKGIPRQFEVLSESDGTLLSIREIVQRNPSNLVY